jgi:hypothetical protein
MLQNVWNSNGLSSNVSLHSTHEPTMECRESDSSGYFHLITNAPTTTSKSNNANLLTTNSEEPHYIFSFRTQFKEILPITLTQAVMLWLMFGMYPFWISIGTLFWARASQFSSLLLGECQDRTSKFVTATTFHPLSNPLFTSHLTIRRYTFWASNSVVKWIIYKSIKAVEVHRPVRGRGPLIF